MAFSIMPSVTCSPKALSWICVRPEKTIRGGRRDGVLVARSHHVRVRRCDIARWGDAGSYGIGGSRGCMRSCMDYLEKHGHVEQTFHNGPFIKRPRWLLPCKVAKGGACGTDRPPEHGRCRG